MLKFKLRLFAPLYLVINILLPGTVMASGDVIFASHHKPEFQYSLKYYRTHWNIDPAEYFISGSVTSYFKPTSSGSLKSIGFDCSTLLNIDSIYYNGQKLNHTAYSTSDSNELLIHLPQAALPSMLDSTTIYYHGIPFDDGESFHQDSHGGAPIITTLSEPYGALLWWPCRQDLTEKADSMDIFITVPAGNLAGSNGVLVGADTSGSNITYHWKERYPIATYLVGVAVTNYVQFTQYSKTSLGDSFPVVNYVYPESLPSLRAMAPATLQMLHLYDSLYGPYPFRKEKYGQAQWNWGGGMEHQTMSFVVDYSFHLVCHEMAHQWFGDKITCGSWKDIWLNEGFAVFNEGMSLEFLQGEGAYFQWIATELPVANDPHGSIYVTDTTNTGTIFSSVLSYAKAGYVLRTLRWLLGDSAFFSAIRQYQADTNLAYNFANTGDIEYYFEKTSGKNLTKFFNDWIYSAGYPHYDVIWQQNANAIQLNINQTPTDSSVSFFDIPVDIQLNFGDTDSLIIVHPTTNYSIFTINTNRKLSSLVVTPGLWYPSDNTVFKAGALSTPVEVYPNPATNQVTINFNRQEISSNGTVILVNTSGKVINSYPTDGLSYLQINTSGLAPGVYFANFVSPTQKYTWKIIKIGQGN